MIKLSKKNLRVKNNIVTSWNMKQQNKKKIIPSVERKRQTEPSN